MTSAHFPFVTSEFQLQWLNTACIFLISVVTMASMHILLSAFQSRAKILRANAQEDFCPRCRGQDADEEPMAIMFAGEVAGTLRSYFASGVLVTASSWAARVDCSNYIQWWSQGLHKGTAWNFSRQVSRCLKRGRLEIVYQETSSKQYVKTNFETFETFEVGKSIGSNSSRTRSRK